MLRKGHFYPGQEINEEVVLFIRRHWVAYLPWLIILPLMIFIATLVLFLAYASGSLSFEGDARVLSIAGISGYLLLVMALFLTSWVDYYFDVTIIYRTHLVDIRQSGFFNRKIAEQSLLRVQDVSARMSGILQTFLQFGTVVVETAGEAPNFELHNIPNPHRVANTILKLHDELVESGSREQEMAEGEGTLRTKVGETNVPFYPSEKNTIEVPEKQQEPAVPLLEQQAAQEPPSPGESIEEPERPAITTSDEPKPLYEDAFEGLDIPNKKGGIEQKTRDFDLARADEVDVKENLNKDVSASDHSDQDDRQGDLQEGESIEL